MLRDQIKKSAEDSQELLRLETEKMKSEVAVLSSANTDLVVELSGYKDRLNIELQRKEDKHTHFTKLEHQLHQDILRLEKKYSAQVTFIFTFFYMLCCCVCLLLLLYLL